MKHIYLLAIIILARLTLNAQSLNGHVIDSTTHHPIEGASVYFPQLRLGATTDRSGSFSIHPLPKGVYDVEVQSMGHATIVRQIDLTGPASIDFVTPISYSPITQ